VKFNEMVEFLNKIFTRKPETRVHNNRFFIESWSLIACLGFHTKLVYQEKTTPDS